ncbi:MAG: hypothetical protein D6767_04910 [Candidatus Hydrogenedentota bacterium]|nr:MAG: hypothetical protein D6767_04910 [Candidatus Hydrogenedentota bacterium]
MVVGLALWLSYKSPEKKGESIQTTKLYSLEELNAITEKTIILREQIPKYIPVRADPFGGYNIIQLSRRQIEEKTSQIQEKPQSRLRLLGIVYDETTPYALVAHANGRTYDVKAGMTVEGELIEKIKPESIIVKVGSVRYELTPSGTREIK